MPAAFRREGVRLQRQAQSEVRRWKADVDGFLWFIQKQLIDTPIVTQAMIEVARKTFRRSHLDDVSINRCQFDRCGFPQCGSSPVHQHTDTYKWKLDFARRQIYDATELSLFCSAECFRKFDLLRSSLSEESIYARDVDLESLRVDGDEVGIHALLHPIAKKTTTPVIRFPSYPKDVDKQSTPNAARGNDSIEHSINDGLATLATVRRQPSISQSTAKSGILRDVAKHSSEAKKTVRWNIPVASLNNNNNNGVYNSTEKAILFEYLTDEPAAPPMKDCPIGYPSDDRPVEYADGAVNLQAADGDSVHRDSSGANYDDRWPEELLPMWQEQKVPTDALLATMTPFAVVMSTWVTWVTPMTTAYVRKIRGEISLQRPDSLLSVKGSPSGDGTLLPTTKLNKVVENIISYLPTELNGLKKHVLVYLSLCRIPSTLPKLEIEVVKFVLGLICLVLTVVPAMDDAEPDSFFTLCEMKFSLPIPLSGEVDCERLLYFLDGVICPMVRDSVRLSELYREMGGVVEHAIGISQGKCSTA